MLNCSEALVLVLKWLIARTAWNKTYIICSVISVPSQTRMHCTCRITSHNSRAESLREDLQHFTALPFFGSSTDFRWSFKNSARNDGDLSFLRYWFWKNMWSLQRQEKLRNRFEERRKMDTYSVVPPSDWHQSTSTWKWTRIWQDCHSCFLPLSLLTPQPIRCSVYSVFLLLRYSPFQRVTNIFYLN